MQNKQLLMFPLISGIAMIIVTIVFIIPMLGIGIVDALTSEGREVSSGQSIAGTIITFIYLFASYTVVIFSNTALVGAVLKILNGEKATVQDGINIASARIGKILVYAFISATVGMIARAITQSGRDSKNVVVAILAAILGSIIQGAWKLVVFFAIPVLVVEDVGVIDSLKRSFEVFKRTWGEGFVGSMAIGGISCLVQIAILLVGGLLIVGAIATKSVVLIVGAVALVVIALVALALVSGAVNGVFQASLYKYATTGDAGPYISNEYAASAFRAV